jgi:hypothetical protein
VTFRQSTNECKLNETAPEIDAGKRLEIVIINSKYKSLIGEKIELTPEGASNGLRSVKDGYAYFGSGEIFTEKDELRSLSSKTSEFVNDVIIHKINTKKKKAERIFEVYFAEESKSFRLRDKLKTMGIFLQLKQPKVRQFSFDKLLVDQESFDDSFWEYLYSV